MSVRIIKWPAQVSDQQCADESPARYDDSYITGLEDHERPQMLNYTARARARDWRQGLREHGSGSL